MHVSALYTYPIKSCAGLTHQTIGFDQRGPLWDRRWVVTDSDGMFYTQRELPPMALIQPVFDGDALRLTAPGMNLMTIPLEAERPEPRMVRVWRADCEAWDEGDELAQWFSDYLKVDARLTRMTDSFVRPVNPDYAPYPAQVGFADGYPALIVSESSLDDLNQRLMERGSEAIPMKRFRPNIVITDSAPFAEDTWREAQIGEMTFDLVKACARCVMTTVDPATGTIPDKAEPLATLNTYRKQERGVMFAQNAIHRASGVLNVGDQVNVIKYQAQPLEFIIQ
ncbi:MAG: MOSC domain-containing protein [Anaerolineaceae bacterium]|nr:MOSC domain-containing protein [Anaerolineaceae bacterium]